MDNIILPNVNPPQKRCSKCQQTKPATTDFFPRERSRKDGLDTSCKVCINAYNRSRHVRKSPMPEVFPDGYKRCTQCKEMKSATLEHFYAKRGTGKLQSACKTCHSANSKAYRLAHLEEYNAYISEYSAAHAE